MKLIKNTDSEKNTNPTDMGKAMNKADKVMEQQTENKAQDTHLVMKLLGWFVIFISTFVWYSPYAYAAKENWNSWEKYGYNQLQNINPLGAELQAIRNQAKLALDDTTQQPEMIENILTKRENVIKLDKQVRQQMRQAAEHIKTKKLHSDIAKRQQKQQQHYIKNSEQTLSLLNKLDNNENPTWLARMTNTLTEWVGDSEEIQTNHTQQKILKQLVQQLSQPFSQPHESYGNDLALLDPPQRDLYTTQAQIDALIGTDTGNYTQADSATTITQAITDKVTEIGTDPLALYNYVYNTVEWIPSYGVMQGADYTLQAEQGNAFDTSSLLIALLRAAGHEARYRYGVIEVPVEQAKNWVGNVINAAAVSNLLGQGNIPNTQVSLGGATERFQLEHVWVQVNVGGLWQDLDPSYKQYTYTEGQDIQDAVPFDAQNLIDQLEASATTNETEGWVQGTDASILQTQLNQYQNDLENYINNNLQNATLADVVGNKRIIPNIAANYQDTLPTYTIQINATNANLPDDLYHVFQYQVADTITPDLGNTFIWNNELLTLNKKTTELVGKDIAISFRPATQADEDALASFMPVDAATIEDLPTSLPAGTINMVGELTIDGQVEESTATVTLGQLLKARIGFIPPQQNWNFRENNLNAGTYRAIGIDMQGISSKQLETIQSTTQILANQIEANDITGLTKHDLIGEILQAGIHGYMGITYSNDRISAQSSDIIYYRKPSFGTLSTSPNIAYQFGVPQNIRFGGVVIDVDRVAMNTEHKGNCYDDWISFVKGAGLRSSAYEHQVLEDLFSTTDNPVEGVSTAKALSVAMAEGQRIYTLTQDNQDQLANIIIDDGARAEIVQALSQGLEVTVHQNPVNVSGWTGSGYSITNTEYGAGIYQISGGQSGGAIDSEEVFDWLGYIENLATLFNLDNFASKVLVAINNAKNFYDIFTTCNADSGAILAFLFAAMLVLSAIAVIGLAGLLLLQIISALLIGFSIGFGLEQDLKRCRE